MGTFFETQVPVSSICVEARRGRMCTRFGSAVGFVDVITFDKFFGDGLRGVDFVWVENCHFLLTKPVAINRADTTAQPVISLGHLHCGRRVSDSCFGRETSGDL